MKQMTLAGTVLLGAWLNAGCCHFSCRSEPAGRPPLPAPVAARFTYPKPFPLECRETNLATEARFGVTRVELPALNDRLGSNRTLALDFYQPRGAGRHAVILVLPTAGGTYPLEKHFAAYFARHGFAAVIVRRPIKIGELKQIESVDALFQQSVLDNKLVLDWIETRSELDASRIGVFGVSMGAIQGALLTPLDRRVSAAVLGLVGGDLPYVLTYSTERGVTRRRKAFLGEHKLTLAQLHASLQQNVSCDPNAFAPYVNPAKVMLVLGYCDTVVPYKKGWELRRRMGKPETILLPTGHYTALLYLPYIRRQTLGFFRHRLNETAVLPRAERTSGFGDDPAAPFFGQAP